ncbi:MAG: FtsQ-type POTRA domain-containing protein [Bacteroidia bacterium]
MSATIINTPKRAPRNRPIEEVTRKQRTKAGTGIGELLKGPLLYVLVLAGAGMLLGAASFYQQELICKDIAVQMDAPEGQQLLSVDDIKEVLGITTGAELLGQPLGSLDLKAMEQAVRQHPSVASAQVFHRLNGHLYVDLVARKPIARVSGVDEDFYIDESGRKFPLSHYFAPNVPLVGGVLDENMEPVDTMGCVLEEIMPVIRYVHNDPFWSAQVSEISRTQAGDIVLYPEVGSVSMILGDVYDLESKFSRLYAFHQQVIRKHGWDKYSSVSVDFKGQVVAKKR